MYRRAVKNLSMIIMKFGGTSVGSPTAIAACADIVKRGRSEGRCGLVVSACGDTTDWLLDAIEAALTGDRESCHDILEKILHYHFDLIDHCVLKKNQKDSRLFVQGNWYLLSEYLDGVATLRECSARARDYIIGHGEILSAHLVAAALRSAGIKAQGIDARGLVVTDDCFGSAGVDFKETAKRIKKNLLPHIKNSVPVITGFIGATKEGVPTTLGRGGSDYSATIIASLIGASRVEIWKDVDGVMSADPRIVADAFTLPALSYEEAMELAYFGAKVVHPKTVAPLMKAGLPIVIRNTLDREAPGTIISKKTAPGVVKGITSIDDLSLITLVGSGIVGVRGVAGRMFATLAKCGINVVMISQASSEHSVCCAIETRFAKTAVSELEREFELELHRTHVQGIKRMDGVSVIAAVGDGMRGTPGVSGRLFSALGRNAINVIAIAQGSSEINVSFVISEKDKVRAINLIHGAFYLSRNRVNLFVVGKGLIGGKLLDQLSENREYVRDSLGIDLRVIGIADHSNQIFRRGAIDLTKWRRIFAKGAERGNFAKLTSTLQGCALENLVLVDATADVEVAKHYADLMRMGVSIATPNKKAGTLPQRAYDEIMEARGNVRSRFLYETTVGAGLPVISTLRDLIDSGDEIIEISGVLSGTLSYIFSRMGSGLSFSSSVIEARERGFTEPDPRDDLSGLDVARKLLILAREVGRRLELSDIKVENLVPGKMRRGGVEGFLRMIPKIDTYFDGRLAKAKKRGYGLQYCATLTARGARVGVVEIPSDSPFGRLKAGDNMVIFKTKRYFTNPLIVQGPGAGPDVTAGGLFADILKMSQMLLK